MLDKLVSKQTRKSFRCPCIITEIDDDCIFVFGDNLIHIGKGGAAKFRHHPNAFGFITKKYPDNKDSSFFTPEDYQKTFKQEKQKLLKCIKNNPDKWILISKLGGGLANKYNIHDVILPFLLSLEKYPNVILLF